MYQRGGKRRLFKKASPMINSPIHCRCYTSCCWLFFLTPHDISRRKEEEKSGDLDFFQPGKGGGEGICQVMRVNFFLSPFLLSEHHPFSLPFFPPEKKIWTRKIAYTKSSGNMCLIRIKWPPLPFLSFPVHGIGKNRPPYVSYKGKELLCRKYRFSQKKKRKSLASIHFPRKKMERGRGDKNGMNWRIDFFSPLITMALSVGRLQAWEGRGKEEEEEKRQLNLAIFVFLVWWRMTKNPKNKKEGGKSVCVQQDNASKVFGKGKEVFSQKVAIHHFPLGRKWELERGGGAVFFAER